LKGVVLVLGPERFLAREAVAKLLLERPQLDVTRFDGQTALPARILDEIRTPTLFGGPRAVIVENAGDVLRAALEAFAAYAEAPVKGTLLVLVATGLDGRLKGAKQLKDAAEVIDCQPLRAWELAKWVRERAKATYGLQTGDTAAAALRRAIGEDLGLLDAALARLKEQIAPRIFLRPEDVEGSTEDHRSPAIFEPGNALEEADLAGTLRALGAAFDEGIRIDQDVVSDEGAVAPILLDSLHRAYVRLLRYHLHRRVGASEEEAARRAGCPPNAFRFFLPNANRHRLETLVARHRHFGEADAALKENGPADPRRVLETLVLALLA
jgi:DNA polymerase-3 subunit delta